MSSALRTIAAIFSPPLAFVLFMLFQSPTANATGPACLQDESLDCSVHPVLQYLDPAKIAAAHYFSTACMNHDYCYRHGNATYGKSKSTCDRAFYREMLSECSYWNLVCKIEAFQFYQAVKHFAGFAYQSDGTCCEYEGPATTVACGAPPPPPPPPKNCGNRNCRSNQICCEANMCVSRSQGCP